VETPSPSPLSSPDADQLPDRPIFIVACPRSGTTLLQLMLHAHPRIAIPPETRHLLETYRHRIKFGDLTTEKGRAAVANYMFKRPKFKDLKLDKTAVKKRIVDGPGTVGSAIGIVLQEYANRYDKPRWGDKRPLYLNHLPIIFRLFPDAQVINIVRDGRACVASLKRMPWWQEGVIGGMTRWVQSMRKAAEAREKLRPDQYYELRYEDLVANPRPELERICAFLGEEFDEAMLEHHRVASEAVPAHKDWHTRTREGVSTAQVEAWKEQLEPWEIAVFERLARKWLQHYGYELTTKPYQVNPIRYASALAHLSKRERTVRGLYREDAERDKTYHQPIAAQLTRGQIERATERGELRLGQRAV
jgi:hypothetical protein